jgi:hypothetical protein
LWLHNGCTADTRCVRLSIIANAGADRGEGTRYLLHLCPHLPLPLETRPDQTRIQEESFVTVLTRTIVQVPSNINLVGVTSVTLKAATMLARLSCRNTTQTLEEFIMQRRIYALR